jgi:hypothetical protein
VNARYFTVKWKNKSAKISPGIDFVMAKKHLVQLLLLGNCCNRRVKITLNQRDMKIYGNLRQDRQDVYF